jgi:hypothetical protein
MCYNVIGDDGCTGIKLEIEDINIIKGVKKKKGKKKDKDG